MRLTIQEIEKFLHEKGLQYEFSGSNTIFVRGFCSLNHPKDENILWIRTVTMEILEKLKDFEHILVVCAKNNHISVEKGGNFIYCEDPKQVYFSILTEFFYKKKERKIDDNAIVKTCKIGGNCHIGAGSVIGEDVEIGDNVLIENNVIIDNRVCVGDNTIIHSGVIIGKDGFGYFKNDDGISIKVPHFGGVEIGHDVEIGANTCIDRGTLDDTIIEDYVKIDNLCHIAHNVIIGKATKITAMSLLAGSSELGEECYLAPGSIVKNQAKVGARCIIGMGAMVLKDVEDQKVIVGSPGKVLREATVEDLKL